MGDGSRRGQHTGAPPSGAGGKPVWWWCGVGEGMVLLLVCPRKNKVHREANHLQFTILEYYTQ